MDSTDDRVKRGEILLTVALVLVFGAIWLKWPAIKVSSKTLERYDLSNPAEPSWQNGIGLTVRARSLLTGADLSPELQPYGELIGRYFAVAVTIDIQGATYPTMIDMPYERMKLLDSAGRAYGLVNRDLSAETKDPKLREMLEVLDWSIVNNTFSRQPRTERALLLFEPEAVAADALTLHLNFYHHPYKQIDLKFEFDRSRPRD